MTLNACGAMFGSAIALAEAIADMVGDRGEDAESGSRQREAVCAGLKGSDPNARFLLRKEREASRGSPRSFARQKASRSG